MGADGARDLRVRDVQGGRGRDIAGGGAARGSLCEFVGPAQRLEGPLLGRREQADGAADVDAFAEEFAVSGRETAAQRRLKARFLELAVAASAAGVGRTQVGAPL